MPENLLDHLGLVPSDEGDDLELGPTASTPQRIRLVNLPDQRRPAVAGLARRRQAGGDAGSGAGRWSPLSPLAACLVRTPPVIPDQVLSRIGYVLGDFGQEVEGIEDLEVAGRSGRQSAVARLGESPQGVALGEK